MNTDATNDSSEPKETYLDRKFWRLWFLLVGLSVLTTGGLAASISPLRSVLDQIWPWGGTEMILLCGLYVVVVLFALHLTHQQKQILALRSGLRQEQRRARETKRRHRSRLFALYTVSQVMGEEIDPQKVFDCITTMCKEVFEGETSSLMLVDSSRERLEVRSAVGHPDIVQVVGKSRGIGEGIAGWVAQHRQPLLLGGTVDESRFPGHELHKNLPESAMVVPLIVRDEVVGVLSLSNHNSQTVYDSEDLTAMRVFAEIAEYCIRHAEQSDWMRKMLDNLRRGEDGAPQPDGDGEMSFVSEEDFFAAVPDDFQAPPPLMASPGFRRRN